MRDLSLSEEIAESVSPYLAFASNGVRYVCPIEYILEIVEGAEFAPYPFSDPMHLGVVNVRGQILPVMSFTPSHSNSGERMILFSIGNEQDFCLYASEIQKVNLATERVAGRESVEVNGEAATVLSLDKIKDLLGVAA